VCPPASPTSSRPRSLLLPTTCGSSAILACPLSDPCVVNRKTWGGNRTWIGAATQGVLTNIIATAAKHGLDPVDYLAGRAHSPDPGLAILLG